MRWLSILAPILILFLASGCQFAPSPAAAVHAQASAVQSVVTAPADSAQAQPQDANPMPSDAAAMPFALQEGYPQYLPAFTQPQAGCAWVGIAGQVFDAQSQPVEGVAVVVKGYFNGVLIESLVLTGLNENYGPAGYEIKIGDQSSESSNALTIQLINERFEPLSSAYPVATYDDCQKNLILHNFVARTAP